MGFNQKYITKEKIINCLEYKEINSLLREVKITKLFESESLILDSWASNFFNSLNPEERNIRKYLYAKYILRSNSDFAVDEEYKKLISLSECLISLYSEKEMWLDIFVATDRLDVNIEKKYTGDYHAMRKQCIDYIIKYFDTPYQYLKKHI